MTQDHGKKTVFITAFSNFVVRNIFATDFFRTLKDRGDLRVIVLAPENGVDYLQKNFSGSSVIIEAVKVLPLTKSRIFFSRLSRMLLNTNTVRLFLRLRLNLKNPKDFLEYFISRCIAIFLGWSRTVRQLLRLGDYYLINKNRFSELFDKYGPDVIFSTDITDRSTGESDIDLIREAKNRRIPVLGMIRSWDNLTSRGIIREVPDKVIVQNEVIKNECIHYNNISEKDILVVGIPHYDNYLKMQSSDKSEFLKELGLSPNKKTVMFVVTADQFLQKQFRKAKVSFNQYVLKLLSALDPSKYQILVRFPLIGEVDLGNFVKPDNMVYDRPGKLFGKGELDQESDRHLVDSIKNSDVVLPGPSTLAIDALLFNKPVIFVGFDQEKGLPKHESIRKFFDVEHLKPLLTLGGARIANDEKELTDFLRLYLEDPSADSGGRRRTVEAVCWKADGHSGDRLAGILLESLKLPF